MATPALLSHYERRASELEKLRAVEAAKSGVLSGRRGIVMLVALPLVLAGLFSTIPSWAWAIAAALGAVFVGLVVAHARVASRELVIEERLKVVHAGERRVRGEPEPAVRYPRKLPDPHGLRFLKAEHPYAGDLDLFGPSSLFVAVSRAETAIGEETLARWLLAPAQVDAVQARQQAVRELLEQPILLEDLAVLSKRSESRGRADEPLTLWGEAPAEMPIGDPLPPELATRRWLVLAARVLVPLTAALFFGRSALAPLHPFAGTAWLVPFLSQLGILMALYGPIARMVSVASSREAPFGRFRAVFARIEELKPTSPLLTEIVDALRAGGEPASRELGRLERVVSFADLRHNTLVHLVANLGLLYDVWVALALERWRARSGKRARAWLTALGQLEALASLATYAGEHPEFVWPDVDDGPARLEAEGLGHPLIPAARRVTNDANLAEPGHALLVTGSNMSGKSTYLRSLGLCAAMAFAGLPVCARRASLSRLDTWTSMRVSDDLDLGMSHFMAELIRLKLVVDAAQGGRKVLFLLDEILHGTNSRERTIGARGVVMDLVAHGAIGGVSTHDFALIKIADDSKGLVRTVHFSDRIENEKMVFDYTLREGVVESTNAIRLMKLVGIDVPYDVG